MTETSRLAEWLRAKMAEEHLDSARALAKYAGLSPDTVSRALRGVRPEVETLEKLARKFGVPRDELMALAGYIEPHSRFAQGAFEGKSEEELEAIRREIDEILARRRRHSS